MKYIFSAFVFFSLSNFAWADSYSCQRNLTDNFSKDSRHIVLNLDEVLDRSYGRDYQAEAIYLVRAALRKVGCNGRADINFGQGPLGRSKTRCARLHRDAYSSLSCYVESSQGYFFVTKDLLTKAHVIFNRWD